MRELDCPFLVVTSDSHCGSTLGLCPPEFQLDDGGSYGVSIAQKALWAQWETFWRDFVPSVTRGRPYAWLHNGDSIEGEHHRTSQTISRNIEDQIRCAQRVFEPWVGKARNFDIVRGTPAHVGEAGQNEETLARLLGCQVRDGQASRWEAWYELRGHLIHAAHHIGTTASVAYEHAALSRELMKTLVESAQWSERPPDLMIRSHRHRYSSAAVPSAHGTAEVIITPAWQLKTGFVWKTNVLSKPQIGGIVIGADEYGLYHRRMIWTPPRSGVVALTRKAAAKQRRHGLTGRSCSAGSGRIAAGKGRRRKS